MKDKIKKADTTIAVYANHDQRIIAEEAEEILIDLFTDLLHWADRNDINWEACFDTARDHRMTEIMEVIRERDREIDADEPR